MTNDPNPGWITSWGSPVRLNDPLESVETLATICSGIAELPGTLSDDSGSTK